MYGCVALALSSFRHRTSFLHTHGDHLGHDDVLLLVLQVVDGEIEAQALYFHSRNVMLLGQSSKLTDKPTLHGR